MKATKIAIVLLLLVLYSAVSSYSQTQLQFQDMLSKEQMQSAGLHKLTASELATLNLYLNLVVTVAIESYGESTYDSYSPGTTSPSGEVLVSRIAGEFTGWDGETIFELQNGQIWQQSSYAYTYHYAYMPEVTIYKVGSQFKMKVEGVGETISVRRIR